jgi:plasmid stabilization system protein ParE
VIAVNWSAAAVAQLQLIIRAELRTRVYRAVGGLARLPMLGRRPPEVLRFPDLALPSDLRELVFPRLVRVFYRYDQRKKEVRVLGMAFRGQDVGPDWLEHLSQ